MTKFKTKNVEGRQASQNKLNGNSEIKMPVQLKSVGYNTLFFTLYTQEAFKCWRVYKKQRRQTNLSCKHFPK